jgi:hypothetical protein
MMEKLGRCLDEILEHHFLEFMLVVVGGILAYAVVAIP